MIIDYSELIAEVSERTGDSDVASRAHLYVGLAETWLSHNLKTSEMKRVANLVSDANGYMSLPEDYLATRALFANGRELPLFSITDPRQGCGYVQRCSNTLGGWDEMGWDEGNWNGDGEYIKLHSSEKEVVHQFHYFARLPSLEQQGTNWLLKRNPALYLHAVCYEVLAAKYDERAAIVRDLRNELLQEEASQDEIGRFNGMQLKPIGPRP